LKAANLQSSRAADGGGKRSGGVAEWQSDSGGD
jgi:hypothetical protein